ncbi:MAG: hypothetical protein ACI8ZN_002375 [Bacteroidia bacterium]|jgi:hypothetical protein
MKRNFLLTCIAFLITLSVYSQQIDCEAIKGEMPRSLKNRNAPVDSIVRSDLNIILSCGSFDAVDRKMFQPPILGIMVFQLAKQQKDINFGNLVEAFQTYKTTEQYLKMRKSFAFMDAYENKIIDKSDSLAVRTGYEQMGIMGPDLDSLIAIIYAEKNAKLTYREAFQLYMASKQ